MKKKKYDRPAWKKKYDRPACPLNIITAPTTCMHLQFPVSINCDKREKCKQEGWRDNHLKPKRTNFQKI